jgi:serine/threonine protein kinase
LTPLDGAHGLRRGFGHQAGQCSGELRRWPVLAEGGGIASRLPCEREAPEPPEFVAWTLAYMAPEQTGRMNRSIDSRSDVYSLGVTLYEMLTGGLPFMASDPMELVHCHIARQPVPPGEPLKNVPAPRLCNHYEAARQDYRGTLPGGGRR